ncbi:antitoxin VbhA family protein [Pectobacterium atrosepticum]|uniref:antitoxin VbhA family protein n=1 Tax=Pectobacterium atrosepticum TaxID=29471 RepID=UPI00301801E7
MSKDVREIISRFWASYQPREDEPSAEELAQVAEDARQRAAAVPPEPACVEWWSVLPMAVQQKWLANPKTPTMREAWRERCKRLEAVNFGRASVGLEGFKPSPEDEALAGRFINGEIEFSEVIETVKEQAQRLR